MTMSTQQVADALGLSASQVRRLARLGELPSEQLSARVSVYTADAVAAYQKVRRKAGWPKGKPRKGMPLPNLEAH